MMMKALAGVTEIRTVASSKQKVSGTLVISDALQSYSFPLLILDYNFLKVREQSRPV